MDRFACRVCTEGSTDTVSSGLANRLFVALAVALLGGGACKPEGQPAGPPRPAAAAAVGSEEQPFTGPVSPNPRWDVVTMLREDQKAPRHPSDGGGRAWIATSPPAALRPSVRSRARFSIVYEAGPLGIAEGGMIFLEVSPFWGWSHPQAFDAAVPGFTRVSTDADGVDVAPEVSDRQLLGVAVRGRALREGEHVRFDYGAGSAGARVDRFAERGSRFWLAVDGDGDGVRGVLPDSPSVDVLPAPAARLVLTLPTVARPREAVRLTVAALDPAGNAAPLLGEVVLHGGDGLGSPERIQLELPDQGHKTVEFVAGAVGTYRLRARGPEGLEAESNPLLVSAREPHIFWGDLHGHSNFSDGTGTPEDYFRYARDVAALDVAALTDHDHWGILFLDQHPEMWQEIRRQVRRFHQPGRFVTLLGYEWTSWIHGHRHVLYFSDEGQVRSSLDPRYESPSDLWSALRGQAALTFAHHSAGGPIATNWSIPPDPELEPVTEVTSVHGSSEAEDSPGRIYAAIPGNYVRDALARGYRLGFVGSGDSHDGHPGLAHVASGQGGLAAIVASDLTRAAILQALRSRRVYATNGARIFLRATLAGAPMGGSVSVGKEGLENATFWTRAIGTAPIERVDIIRSGQVIESVPLSEERRVELQRPLRGLRADEYVYVRVVQTDGKTAWSSPIFIESKPDVP